MQNNKTSTVIKRKLKSQGIFFFKEIQKNIFTQIPSPFIICDQKLKPKIQKWIQQKGIYFVSGGESLKDINKFPLHVQKIAKKISLLKKKPSCFVGIGGGSLTDFTGFFSSLYKRGRPVYYIPTTLLSALDAVHGGKTAVNLGAVKNYLGTYHFPKKVFIIKNLIQSHPLWKPALGELIKIALVQSFSLYKKLNKTNLHSFDCVWPLLPYGIQAKLDIVQKDPFETKGFRKHLNFGHTLGHGLERLQNLPHGQAVAVGMKLALFWSLEKKILKFPQAQQLLDLVQVCIPVHFKPQVSVRLLKKLFFEDKKSVDSHFIDFVFLKKPGQAVVQKTSVMELVQFYKKIKHKL